MLCLSISGFSLFNSWHWDVIVTFSKDIDGHLLLLQLIWTIVVLLAVLVELLAAEIILESLALLLVLDRVDLHLFFLLIFLGLDLDLLLDDALVFSSSLLLSFYISVPFQAVLLLEADSSVLIEQGDVLFVEFQRFLLFLRFWLSSGFILLAVSFLGLLFEEFLFDFVISNNEFSEL